ncbi:unnamed protein product [Prorocentrum cordatum]|uniref:Uncharacterized protein n=1 Tax=Prorocentrum cordatum TaxID=2364126 RepID=A0ABN9XJZ3_9DINO|nr:unnamed protein product [Polarella glacialis]
MAAAATGPGGFFCGGSWTPPLSIFSGVAAGGAVRRDLGPLPQWPTKLKVIADGTDEWGFRRIVLRSGGTAHVVLSSADGQGLGDNQYWVGTKAGRLQEYSVPSFSGPPRGCGGGNCTPRAKSAEAWTASRTEGKCSETADSHGKCSESVMWAMSHGIWEHPEWYPGLAATSSFEQFQALLHAQGHGGCPRVVSLPLARVQMSGEFESEADSVGRARRLRPAAERCYWIVTPRAARAGPAAPATQAFLAAWLDELSAMGALRFCAACRSAREALGADGAAAAAFAVTRPWRANLAGSLRLWRRAWEARSNASCALGLRGGAWLKTVIAALLVSGKGARIDPLNGSCEMELQMLVLFEDSQFGAAIVAPWRTGQMQLAPNPLDVCNTVLADGFDICLLVPQAQGGREIALEGVLTRSALRALTEWMLTRLTHE